MPTRTTPAKTTAAKRPPGRPRKTAAPPPPAEPQETPLVVFAPPPADAKPAKRVLVFTDFRDRKFYAPEVPHTGIALRYMRLLRTNEESAYLYLIEAMCGVEAYDALADDPDTTLDRVAQVVGALRRLLQGRLEDPKA